MLGAPTSSACHFNGVTEGNLFVSSSSPSALVRARLEGTCCFCERRVGNGAEAPMEGWVFHIGTLFSTILGILSEGAKWEALGTL
jgi:hypothetical protein